MSNQREIEVTELLKRVAELIVDGYNYHHAIGTLEWAVDQERTRRRRKERAA
jgi:hypothetical protein